jgi:hypothetical protein
MKEGDVGGLGEGFGGVEGGEVDMELGLISNERSKMTGVLFCKYNEECSVVVLNG